MKWIVGLLLACVPLLVSGQKSAAKDAILGRWITERKNLIVEVYLQGEQYRARIISFTDHHNPKPPEQRVDDKNPVKTLRSRKIIGMDVLQGLTYNSKSNRWENGHIYDATSGKTWNASAQIISNGKLLVRGYWGIEMFGKTLTFVRWKQQLAK